MKNLFLLIFFFFSLTVTYAQVITYEDFEGGTNDIAWEGFNGGTYNGPVVNPNPDAINSSGFVGSFTNDGVGDFNYAFATLGSTVDLSTYNLIKMKVWSPVAPSQVLFKFEGGGNQVEMFRNITVANAWVEYSFDLGAGAAFTTMDKVLISFNPFTTPFAGTFYFDDITAQRAIEEYETFEGGAALPWNALNGSFSGKLTPAVSFGHNIAFSSVREDAAPGVITSAYNMPPVFSERDANGDFTDPTFFGLALANPAADLFYKENNRNAGTRLFGNLYVDVDFLKNFTFRSNLGFDRIQKKTRYFEPKFEVSASQRNLNDRLTVGLFNATEWIWEQTVSYDRTWGDHHITALVGYTAEERVGERLGGSRENFPGTAEEILYLSSGNDTTQMNFHEAADEALNSNLFRINYGFRERYLLTLTWRTDRSSRFIKANRTGHFPSAGIGWNIGAEPFMSDVDWVDRFKFRASYGILGNQNASSTYPSTGAVTSGLYGVFGPNESLNQGATLVSLSNSNLKWETSSQTDIGMELSLFAGQMEIEVDWYKRHTYDIIAAVPIPDYVGSQNDPVVNTAEVDNEGWDITAIWRQGGKFSYNFGVILSPVTNRVVKLANGRNEIFAAFLQGEPATHTVVGLPIGAFYGYKVGGIFQTQEEISASPNFGVEKPGDIRYVDTNGDGKLDGDDRVYLGSPIPTMTYSFTAGAEWSGFDLSADVVGASGHKVYNAKETFRFAVYNWEQHIADRWTVENPSLTEPRISNGGPNYRVSDRFLQDGSFVRLRSVTLGYTLPKALLEKANITRLRVYVTGTNVWSHQNYSGYSPEFPNGGNSYEVGFDFGAYPITKAWQGGIELNF